MVESLAKRISGFPVSAVRLAKSCCFGERRADPRRLARRGLLVCSFAANTRITKSDEAIS